MTFAPVKVLHIITGLGVGGAESMLTTLVTAAAPKGLRHVVVDMLADGAYANRIEEAGIPLYELGLRRGRPSFRAFRRLAGIIAREKPDVVQSWMYHADLAAAGSLVLSGRYRKTRLYWGVRCSDMDARQYGLAFRCVLRACTALSRLPEAIVANSETGRLVHERLGYKARRFLVFDNGIDTERFKPDPRARADLRDELGIPQDAPVVVLPARLDPMKDHGTFLAALDKLPNVIAIAAGDNTQFLPERDNLRALGPRGDIDKCYAAADLVLSTSAFGEGFSNAIAEGMASGLPVVATDVGDARRIVDDAGIVVPVRDPVAIADAVRSILESSTRKELGERARRRICEHYSVDRFVDAYNGLYTEAT